MREDRGLSFIKNFYFIFAFFTLIGLVVFFHFYNIYLADHSLIYLRFVLNKAGQTRTLEDFEKIKPFLKIPLIREISNIEVSSTTLTSLEVVDTLATSPKTLKQIEDIKFYLKNIINEKEKKRGAILSFLDNLNLAFFGAKVKTSRKNLEAKEKLLLNKIEDTRDQTMLQQIYYELGSLYIQMDKIDKAEQLFMKTIHINPYNKLGTKAKFNLAWVYKSKGEYDKAIEIFEELAKEAAEKEIETASDFQIADALYKKGQYVESRQKLVKLSSSNPDLEIADIALFQASYISLYDLNDKETVLKYFSDLKKKSSQTKTTEYIVAKSNEAIASAFRIEGYNLLKQNKYKQAIEAFNKALEVLPYDSSAYSGLSLGFYWLGDKDKALEYAKKSVESANEDPIPLINSLFIYINCNQLEKAIETGESVLFTKKISRPEFYYNLSYAYIITGKLERAIKQLEEVIKANPDFVFAYNNLGSLFWSAARYSQAIQMFREAISIDPQYVDAHFNLGISYFYLEQLEDAYKEFKKVLEINPNYQQAKYYIDIILKNIKL